MAFAPYTPQAIAATWAAQPVADFSPSATMMYSMTARQSKLLSYRGELMVHVVRTLVDYKRIRAAIKAQLGCLDPVEMEQAYRIIWRHSGILGLARLAEGFVRAVYMAGSHPDSTVLDRHGATWTCGQESALFVEAMTRRGSTVRAAGLELTRLRGYRPTDYDRAPTVSADNKARASRHARYAEHEATAADERKDDGNEYEDQLLKLRRLRDLSIIGAES